MGGPFRGRGITGNGADLRSDRVRDFRNNFTQARYTEKKGNDNWCCADMDNALEAKRDTTTADEVCMK